MRMYSTGTGQVIPGSGSDEAVLVVPLSFRLGERESHALHEANVASIDFGDRVKVRPTGSATLHPHASPGADAAPAIQYPVHLRSDGPDRLNRLDLHLPIAIDPGGETRPDLIEGELKLDLTFRGIVSIPFRLLLSWDTERDSIRVSKIQRRDSVGPLLTSLGLLAGILIALSTWNELFNKSVHHQAPLLSPESVDKAIFFLIGFFGIQALTLAWRTLGDWVSLASLPELYLSPETSLFLRSPKVSASLCVSLAPLAGLVFLFWSVPRPAGDAQDPPMHWFDSDAQAVTKERVYRRELPELTLHCGDASQPLLARIEGRDRTVHFVDYSVIFRDHSWDSVGEDCEELESIGEHDKIYPFTAERAFADECLETVRNEVLSLLCGKSPGPTTYHVGWDPSADHAVEISNPTRLAAGSLDRFAAETWWPLLERQNNPKRLLDVVKPKDLVDRLLQRGDFEVGKAIVERETFRDLYERHLETFRTGSPAEGVRAMIVLSALLDLYLRTESPPLTDVELREFRDDLLLLYPDESNTDLDLQDKRRLRAYLRFLLTVERRHCGLDGALDLTQALQTVFWKEGYEYYLLYLEEWLWVANEYPPIYSSPRSCRSTEAQLDFLRSSLESVKDDAVTMRGDLSALAEPLRADRTYFSNELGLLDGLLAEVAKTRVATSPDSSGEGPPIDTRSR